MYQKYTDKEIEQILQKRLEGQIPSVMESAQFKTACMVALGAIYREANWVMQITSVV